MSRIAEPGPGLSRRAFARLLAAALPGLALAPREGPPATGRGRDGPGESPMTARRGIASLRLLAPDLAAQKSFYRDTLGLPVVRDSEEELTIGAGTTRLSFRGARPADGSPIYHFAFNIPENKLPAAQEWLAARTPLIVKEGRKVFHFPTWNAHSIYFHDAAGNIGELIARHDLDNAAPGPFAVEDVLYASEIGLVVDDVPGTVEALDTHLGLPVYRAGTSTLVPVGDEHRLLIVVRRGHVWLPTRNTEAAVFPIEAELAAARPATYTLPGYPFALTLSPGGQGEPAAGS
jgi:catechol-2,3-dioxygenase